MKITKTSINEYSYADISIAVLLFLMIYNFNMTSTILIFVYFGLALYTLGTQGDVVENFSRRDVFYGVTIFLFLYQLVQDPIYIIFLALWLIFIGSLKYIFDEYGYPLDHLSKKLNIEKMTEDIHKRKKKLKENLEEKGITQENIQKKMDVFNENGE